MTAPSGRADDLTWRTRALGAVAGVLAAAVAMGAAQFASGLGVPQSSPVFAVGQAAIDLTPAKVKDFAIAAFGANDKTVLLGGILVVLAASAAVAGMLAVRRLASGVCALAILASIGVGGEDRDRARRAAHPAGHLDRHRPDRSGRGPRVYDPLRHATGEGAGHGLGEQPPESVTWQVTLGIGPDGIGQATVANSA